MGSCTGSVAPGWGSPTRNSALIRFTRSTFAETAYGFQVAVTPPQSDFDRLKQDSWRLYTRNPGGAIIDGNQDALLV